MKITRKRLEHLLTWRKEIKWHRHLLTNKISIYRYIFIFSLSEFRCINNPLSILIPVLSSLGHEDGYTWIVIETRSNQSGPGNFLQFSHCKWNLCIRWAVLSPLILLISIVTLRFRWGGLMLWFCFLGILLLPQWLWAGLQSLWDICPCPAILLQCVLFQGELTLLSPSEFLNVSTGRQSWGGTGVKIRLLCQVN